MRETEGGKEEVKHGLEPLQIKLAGKFRVGISLRTGELVG